MPALVAGERWDSIRHAVEGGHVGRPAVVANVEEGGHQVQRGSLFELRGHRAKNGHATVDEVRFRDEPAKKLSSSTSKAKQSRIL